MIEIGKMNKLTVHEKTSDGFNLRAADLDIDILLSTREATKDLKTGDEVTAFVYVENDGKTVASLKKPNALLDEFCVTRVLETHQFGAFVDWGITKDLLIPDTEQKDKVGENQFYIVRVCIDEHTNKLYGTTKVGKYIQESKFDIAAQDKVSIVPARKEELGYRCLINKKFIGMIYYNEIFQKIAIGEELTGVVKKIRPDGLVDAALQVQGFQNILDSKEKVLAYLQEVGGKSHLYDKSSPDEIKSILNMSKKTFKSTIGMLYKERKIIITKDGIELVKS